MYYFLIIFHLIRTGICQDPVLQELLNPKQLQEGQTVKLHCDLIEGKQPVNFYWKFNGKKLETNDEFLIINKEEETSLKIKNLSFNHLGSYSCSAENEYGKNEKQTKINFNGN